MLTDFSLIPGRTTEQVLEVQFNEAIGVVRLKEQPPVALRLSQCCDQTLNSEVAVDEESFDGGLNVQLHQVAVAEDLPVHGTDDVFSVAAILVGGCGQGGSGHGLRGGASKGAGIGVRVMGPLEGGWWCEAGRDDPRDHITSVMETIRPPRAWMYFIWLLMSLPETR